MNRSETVTGALPVSQQPETAHSNLPQYFVSQNVSDLLFLSTLQTLLRPNPVLLRNRVQLLHGFKEEYGDVLNLIDAVFEAVVNCIVTHGSRFMKILRKIGGYAVCRKVIDFLLKRFADASLLICNFLRCGSVHRRC
jgi:hypothetical protein